MRLHRPQGIVKVVCNGSISVKVFQKVLCSDDFRPRPGSSRGGGRFQTLQVKSQGYQIFRTVIYADGERSYATDIPLFLFVEEAQVSDGVEGRCSTTDGPDYVKLK